MGRQGQPAPRWSKRPPLPPKKHQQWPSTTEEGAGIDRRATVVESTSMPPARRRAIAGLAPAIGLAPEHQGAGVGRRLGHGPSSGHTGGNPS